jgi:hypothetical protein
MAAFHLSRAYTDRSLPQIGRHYHRDHTTVIHGVRQIPTMLIKVEGFSEKLQAAVDILDGEGPRITARIAKSVRQHFVAQLAPTWC